MALLIIPTFLSAFLLFQIELIIAKLFLPNYGGSYLVWGACIVFFQAVLLGGYIFAHAFLQRLGVSSYLKIHIGLLLLPFLFFPLCRLHLSFGGSSLPLVVDIFWRLLVTIGPVFFVLSTMSLVTQSWLASSLLKSRHDPYGLYAVSNLGSFAALMSYPFVFEQYLTNTQQLQIWRVLYSILVAVNLLAWGLIKINRERLGGEGMAAGKKISSWQVLRWIVLGAAGVMMFLSVTNIITYEVAPVPLLWVVPLGIYLMAFVLNFKKKPWCPAWIGTYIGPLIGLCAMKYFLAQKHLLPIILIISLLCALLFLICLYIQNQLIKARPSSDGQITLFYVMISLGGFLGGMAVSWIIPLVSNTLIEFLAGLLLVSLIMPENPNPRPWWRLGAAVVMVGLDFFIWPQVFKYYSLWSFALLWVTVWFAFAELSSHKKLFIGVLAGIILATPFLESIWQNAHFIIKKRNYYGIYEIYDSPNGVRALVHGTTLHGVEFVDEAKRRIPLGYYSPLSGIGSLLINDTFQARRIGVVGLGAGTLSMYSTLACPIDYFELDPDVKNLASRYFWYLDQAPGEVNVILGDARLSLNHSPDGTYDFLVIDAFSGDSIPTHLVNQDVLREYRQKLNPRGAVVFHITNRYLNLEPVLARIAESSGAYAAIKDVGDEGYNMRSIWCLLTWDDERYLKLISKEDWEPLEVDEKTPGRIWSDDYSTILPIINMDELAASLKTFKPLTW